MNLENAVKGEKEIIRELNQCNTNNLQELLGITRSMCDMYEHCKCGFISKSKETGLCKVCEGEK